MPDPVTLITLDAKLDEILAALVVIKADIDAPRSVQRICHHCGGDGQKGTVGSEVTCPDCGGDGVVILGRITLTAAE